MGETPSITDALLAKGAVTQEQIDVARERQALTGGTLESALHELGFLKDEDLLAATAAKWGMPAVDLRASVIPLPLLDAIPAQVAKDAGLLPLALESDRLFLAVSNPGDRQLLDEVGFVTGKKVVPHAAIEPHLREVVREAYALHARDPEARFYRGVHAPFAAGQEPAAGHLATVVEDLPDEDVPFLQDDEVLTLGVIPQAAATVPPALPTEAAASAAPSGGHTVLVVDDEPETVELLSKVLGSEGFKVVTAVAGREALEAVKTHRPDLVLLDAMLPEIHGFEICRKIKTSKKYSHTLIVMVSAIYKGWRYAEDIRNNYGADDFIEKPFRIQPLILRVKELLGDKTPAGSIEIDAAAIEQALKTGIALSRQGKHREAHQALQEACQLDPFDPEIHFALANNFLAGEKVYEAIREYEHTVELKPDAYLPLKTLAVLYQKKGFRTKATELWERALRCAPDQASQQEMHKRLLALLKPGAK